jgi:hypothetical protein
MGEDSKGIAASSGGSQNDWFGSCKAHDVGVSPEEDRSGTAGEMGEVQSSKEEGGLEPAERLRLATTEPITRIVLHSYSSEEYRQLCCLWSMPSVKACAPVHSFEEPTFPASKGWLVRPPR